MAVEHINAFERLQKAIGKMQVVMRTDKAEEGLELEG